jgi:hypothetical protein
MVGMRHEPFITLEIRGTFVVGIEPNEGCKASYDTTFLRRFCRNTGSEKPDVDIGDVFVDLDDCVNLLSVYSVSNGK